MYANFSPFASIKVHVHVIVYYYQILNHVNTITGTCRIATLRLTGNLIIYVNMQLMLVDMQHNYVNMQQKKLHVNIIMLHVHIINLFPLAFFRT